MNDDKVIDVLSELTVQGDEGLRILMFLEQDKLYNFIMEEE